MLNDKFVAFPSSPSRSTAAEDIAVAEEDIILQGQQGIPPAGGPKHDDGSPVAEAECPPSRWVMVEPWSSLLLLSDHVREGRDDEILQDRKLAEALVGSREEQEAILQDVPRTRTDSPVFGDEKARQWLQRSVSLYCRERGLKYSQGLTHLAAPWALITDPPCLNGFSYRCFRSFVDRFAPNIFSTAQEETGGGTTLVVLEAHLVLLEQLLRFHDPALAAHMDKCFVSPAAYATPWFVTLFASQTPAPALLHLWRLMLEYGDPVLHQFLSLAWLVSNRLVLMETPPDDMPATVSGLRLRSAGVVDDVFRAAVALRESTPRLFCDVLRRACFAEDREGDGGGSCEGPGAPAGGRQQSGPPAGGPAAEPRVSLLQGLRAEEVLSVDADQVAEILLAGPSSTAVPAAAAPTSPATGDDGWRSGSRKFGGTFVLVDCRPPAPESEGPAGGGMRAGGEPAGDGRVIWRRVHPAESFGREAVAVAEVLREVEAGEDALHGERSGAPCHKEAVEGAAPAHDIVGMSVVSGSSSVVAAPYGNVGGGAAGNGLVHPTRICGHAVSGGGIRIGEVKHPVGTSTTHVCFIGCGGRGGSGGDGGGRFTSFATAAAEAAAPEFRLAREASRSCLTPRVCVLQGGFAALDGAMLSRGRSSENGRGVPEVGAAKCSVAAEECPPFRAAAPDAVGASANGSSEEGGTGADESSGARGGGGGEGGGIPAEGDAEKLVSTTTQAAGGGSPPSSASPRGGTGGGNPTPPPQIPPFSQGLERKASRLAENSKISEPFRVYAARSADEMGRALRSLPLTASKPLEDAARVCNSLLRTNARALGDSRLSLSRSVTQLELLNARMDGTARGFAKSFGAGLHRAKGGGT
ncbi:unnamed protein product [Ectocarpus sp. CCAP 1310/34]|nr:unnamed protein product [Ectocarpus sp. CCAP 1310/34]